MIWHILKFPNFEYYPANSSMAQPPFEYGPASLSQAHVTRSLLIMYDPYPLAFLSMVIIRKAGPYLEWLSLTQTG